jgi:competence protein ComEC
MITSFIFGFIIGIGVGSFVSINIVFIFAFSLLTLIVFIYQYFVNKEHRVVLIYITILSLGFLFGIGRMFISDLYTKSQLDQFIKISSHDLTESVINQKINVEGVIVGEPDVRENNTKLTVKLSHIIVGTTTIPVSEKILVTVPTHPEFHYGDKVQMSVILVEPSEIESSDGRVFDYKGYLRVRGIWYISRFTTIDFISSSNGNPIKKLLFKTKNAFVASINNALPQPESSLLGGLLLGSKQSLGKDLLLEFQKTGVSHIVVLSGYNIAVVASSIIEFFKFLPKNLSFGFGVVGIFLFSILSGGGASVWRASIMVLVALFAKQSNRDYKVARIFGFTIVIMLAPNPLLLAFDPSFQLSVLATTGLIFVSPFITPYLLWVTERFGLREIISSTIATQITVLPYLIYNMGLLSLVSLPVNILILGTIPLTMFLGFITGIVGLFSLYLSFIPAFFTYILLWYQLKIVHLGSSIPFGAISFSSFSPIILVLIYVIIFAILYFLVNKKRPTV